MRGWPKTPKGWCGLFKRLDIRFETWTTSPLHHDKRCPVHGINRHFRTEEPEWARDIRDAIEGIE